MKNIIVFIFCLNCLSLSAQELNLGSNLGYRFIRESQKSYRDEKNALTFSGCFEFHPKQALFSLNTELRCLFEKEPKFQIPVFLKFIFGNKFRVCPSIGAFYVSNGNYGVQLGLNCEVSISKKASIYTRYEVYSEIFEESIPSHFGNVSKSKSARSANWFGIGVKYNLL